ncbi:L,D-transpeptidase family protein [Microbacterium sp. YY-03]|uniref:L,D-transpeptidase family protein n=1 Tax=Microbacterium sp. YY-03 TaxID=3421636 RepID=UPI003D172F38
MANAYDEHDSAPENTDDATVADASMTATGAAGAAGSDSGSGSTVGADGQVYTWAPASEEPKKKHKRRWPWIAIPAAGVVAGLVVASMTLIAPGVSAAGVPVGGLTKSAAANAIDARVANATVTLETSAGTVTLTGADLGATIDAEAVAAEAFNSAPAWNVSSWGSDAATTPVSIDDAQAQDALRAALPDLYVDPVDAELTLNKTTGAYTVIPAADGKGISLDTVRTALADAVASEKGAATVEVKTTAIPALLTTEEAQTAADDINALTADVGFYVGDERTVPVDAPLAATWITPSFSDDGTLVISANEAEIAKFTATLPSKVDRPAVDGVKLVDRQGNQLPDSIYTKEGVEGRTIGDVSKIASAFATQLEEGNGHYPLTVTTVEPKETTLERWIEVDVSEQTVYVWENGQTVRVMLTSSGLPPYESARGTFRINSHVVMQDMGCVPGYDYCTKDVKWVMYYNGDEAFHGTWWHDNFGNKMSHGCMNLSEANAKWLWDWTPIGTEVWVHD